MTCIAGLIDGDKVYIGGDSAGSNGHSMMVRADEKVFKRDEFVFGFTSSFRMGQLLRYKLEIPYHRPDVSIEFYMNTEFIDAVRKCLKDGGYATSKDGADEGGIFLVGYRGRLFYIGSDFQVGESCHDYYSVGCGEDLALGSLYSTDGSSYLPEYRITLALKASEEFNAGVRGPFVIVST